MDRRLGALALAALVMGHVVGMVDLVALPVWVGALVDRYGFQPQQAGALVTLFLLGAVAASVTLARRFGRGNGRAVASGGFAVAALAFLGASTQTNFVPLALCHALAGVAVGSGLSMVHGAIGRSAKPHRNFALANVMLGFFAIAFLGGVPQLMLAQGPQALFQVYAAVMALAALALLLFFRDPGAGEAATVAGPLPRPVKLLVAGVCLMTFNQAMIFSFVEVIGAARGFAHEAVLGALLALGLVNALLAGPGAALLEHRLPAFTVIRAGAVVQALLALAMATTGAFPLWAGVTAVFVGVQIFTHPFAFGLLAGMDGSGRVVAATPAMLMIGSALGPVVGGALGQSLGFGALGVAALALGALAFTCFTLARRAVPEAVPA
ncbi:MFS transporter [Cereibacter sphaeroides]|nr:MFS transporter [Cereibacter sphaeroides]